MDPILTALLVSAIAATEPPAQATAPVSTTSADATWSVAAGYETWALRDIARSTLPMDGSPVSLTGSGPAFALRYERARRRRLHRLDLSLAYAGGFAFDTPANRIRLSSSDRIIRIDGRYDYSRFPFIDVFIDGFDLGIGIQGNVARRSLSRELPGAVALSQAVTEVGFGIPIVARLQRWTRAQVEVAFSTGLAIGRSRQSHGAGTGIEDGYAGGGGTAEFTTNVRVRISPQMQLITTYIGTQDWRLSDHRSYSARRRQLAIGASYGR